MDKSEREDFNNALQRGGYTPDDFNIVETDTTHWNANEITPVTGTALIMHIRTSKSKEYHRHRNQMDNRI